MSEKLFLYNKYILVTRRKYHFSDTFCKNIHLKNRLKTWFHYSLSLSLVGGNVLISSNVCHNACLQCTSQNSENHKTYHKHIWKRNKKCNEKVCIFSSKIIGRDIENNEQYIVPSLFMNYEKLKHGINSGHFDAYVSWTLFKNRESFLLFLISRSYAGQKYSLYDVTDGFYNTLSSLDF